MLIGGIRVSRRRGRTIMPGRVEAADESPCSATAMRQATRRMTQLYAYALAPAGLRSTQYAILEELHRQADAPPTMGEMAETRVLDQSALRHNLRPLERDGLIALVAGDNDRRRRRVCSPQGDAPSLRRLGELGNWHRTGSTTCSANQQQRNSEPPCSASHVTTAWPR